MGKTGYFLYGLKNEKKNEVIYAVGPVLGSKQNIAAYMVTEWGACPSSGKNGMFSYSANGFELKYDYSISCENKVKGEWSEWDSCDCDKTEQVRFRGENYQQVRGCDCEKSENEEEIEIEEKSEVSVKSEGIITDDYE